MEVVTRPLFPTDIYHKQNTLLWSPDYCSNGTKKMTYKHDHKYLSHKTVQIGEVTTKTMIHSYKYKNYIIQV